MIVIQTPPVIPDPPPPPPPPSIAHQTTPIPISIRQSFTHLYLLPERYWESGREMLQRSSPSTQKTKNRSHISSKKTDHLHSYCFNKASLKALPRTKAQCVLVFIYICGLVSILSDKLVSYQLSLRAREICKIQCTTMLDLGH